MDTNKVELSEMTFTKLVEAINDKWSHTYIDVPEMEDQPEYDVEMERALAEIAELQGKDQNYDDNYEA